MSADPPVSLVAKIRKLLAKAEGTDNPNEAEAFSAKAAQLIAAHRIDPRHVAEALASGDLGVRQIAVGRGAYVRARLALLTAVAGNQDFTFIGAAAFTAPGQINWFSNGTDTFIQLNTNADLTVDGIIQLRGVPTGDAVLMFL